MYIKIDKQEEQNLAMVLNISQMLMMKATSLFSDHEHKRNGGELQEYAAEQCEVSCLIHISYMKW
jgi:hypothetical protein